MKTLFYSTLQLLNQFRRRFWALGLTFALALTACSPHKGSNGGSNKGGQDGGGGEASYSTREQVRAAIEKSYRLVTDPSPNKNAVVRYIQNRRMDKAPKPMRLFPKVTSSDEVYIPHGQDLYSPAIDALRKRKPKLIDDGDCDQGTRAHADASVSHFDLDGDVCFSVGNLTRIPPDTLMPEILALYVHELTHLAGATSEAEADDWQQNAKMFYVGIFAPISVGIYSASFQAFTQIGSISKLLHHAKVTAEAGHDLYSVAIWLGTVLERVKSLPFYDDPMMLNLAEDAKKPDYVDNYSNAVIVYLQKYIPQAGTFEGIGIKRSGQRFDGRVALTDADLVKLVEAMNSDFVTIYRNHSYFVYGLGESICLLPSKMSRVDSDALWSFVENSAHLTQNIEPVTPTCDGTTTSNVANPTDPSADHAR